MLTTDETLDVLMYMADLADKDCEAVSSGDFEIAAAYWEGWSEGLRTLMNHIKTDVKVTCFPTGSCECHQSRTVKV